MTIYDVAKQRGLKLAFGNSYLNPTTYDGIEAVIFITDMDAERMRGYDSKKTLFVVSENQTDSNHKLSNIIDSLSVLFQMSKVVVSRANRTIRITKFKA